MGSQRIAFIEYGSWYLIQGHRCKLPPVNCTLFPVISLFPSQENEQNVTFLLVKARLWPPLFFLDLLFVFGKGQDEEGNDPISYFYYTLILFFLQAILLWVRYTLAFPFLQGGYLPKCWCCVRSGFQLKASRYFLPHFLNITAMSTATHWLTLRLSCYMAKPKFGSERLFSLIESLLSCCFFPLSSPTFALNLSQEVLFFWPQSRVCNLNSLSSSHQPPLRYWGLKEEEENTVVRALSLYLLRESRGKKKEERAKANKRTP